MAKWAGKIGFAIPTETAPGVWEDVEVERNYCGDLNSNKYRPQTSSNLNDNFVVANEISFVADPYANENFHHIRYAEFMGVKWKISNYNVLHPRLILTLGDVYNG